MKLQIRGSGFRHTLPAVFKFSGLWFFVLVLTTPIVAVALMMNGVIEPRGEVWFFLLSRMAIIVLAGIALAVLTTARAAGPMVHLTRVFDDIKNGNMDRRLSFRASDKHFLGVETAFNQMMVALNERGDFHMGVEAEDRMAR